MPKLRNGSKEGFEPGVRHSTIELARSTSNYYAPHVFLSEQEKYEHGIKVLFTICLRLLRSAC